jgi:hypothetical protein
VQSLPSTPFVNASCDSPYRCGWLTRIEPCCSFTFCWALMEATSRHVRAARTCSRLPRFAKAPHLFCRHRHYRLPLFFSDNSCETRPCAARKPRREGDSSACCESECKALIIKQEAVSKLDNSQTVGLAGRGEKGGPCGAIEAAQCAGPSQRSDLSGMVVINHGRGVLARRPWPWMFVHSPVLPPLPSHVSCITAWSHPFAASGSDINSSAGPTIQEAPNSRSRLDCLPWN